MDATLSRIETKLDGALARQSIQERQIDRIWARLGRIDVRVAMISAGVGLVAWLLELIFKH